MSNRTEKPVASVTIYNASHMTPHRRKAIAEWLKHVGTDLQRFGENYATRFTARRFLEILLANPYQPQFNP